jgi:pilus assembly protein CpaB
MTMRQRAFTILLIAFAAISAIVYRLVLTRIIMAPGSQTTEIVVAVRKLEIGTLVKDTDIKPAYWAGPVPPGVALKKEAVVGRRVVSTIYGGEPILVSPSGAGRWWQGAPKGYIEGDFADPVQRSLPQA